MRNWLASRRRQVGGFAPGHGDAARGALEHVLAAMRLIRRDPARQPHRVHAVWAKRRRLVHVEAVTPPGEAAQVPIWPALKSGTGAAREALKSAPSQGARGSPVTAQQHLQSQAELCRRTADD